jgi:hypothetical protein
MFSYWRDKRTGLCHMSLAGTGWPATYYERISGEEYDAFKNGWVIPASAEERSRMATLTSEEIQRAALDSMETGDEGRRED